MPQKSLPISIFAYRDYRRFLADLFESWRERVRNWSYSYFSRRAGFSAPNYLRLIIDGTRNLGPDSVEKIVCFFEFNKQESSYFSELVLMNQAKTDEKREQHYRNICKMPGYIASHRDEKQLHKFYSTWYNPAIRELVELATFNEDPEWIASQLEPKITPREAASALKMLLDSGQLKRTDDGLAQASPVISTGEEVASLAVANYHREMIEQAKSSLDRLPADQRNLSSLTMAVSREMYGKIVEEIYTFQNRLITLVEQDAKAEEVVQLNFQLFPLTRRHGGSDA